jgi:hypothetical protein
MNVVPTSQTHWKMVEHTEMVTHMVNEVSKFQSNFPSALSHCLVPQVVAHTVPITRQVPKQVTSTIQENGRNRQVTETIMETVQDVTTHYVTVQKPVQHAVKRVSRVPQAVVDGHEVIIQHGWPRIMQINNTPFPCHMQIVTPCLLPSRYSPFLMSRIHPVYLICCAHPSSPPFLIKMSWPHISLHPSICIVLFSQTMYN